VFCLNVLYALMLLQEAAKVQCYNQYDVCKYKRMETSKSRKARAIGWGVRTHQMVCILHGSVSESQ
jgi:hypothetical protein